MGVSGPQIMKSSADNLSVDLNEAFAGLKTSENGSSVSLGAASSYPHTEATPATTHLQKSQSVPHLTNNNNNNNNSSPSSSSADNVLLFGTQNQASFKQRKKTTEANSIPEVLLHPELVSENTELKERLLHTEEVNRDLKQINHRWDSDYNTLKDKATAMESMISTLHEEVTNKENHINRLRKKLEMFINEGCNEPNEKSSWEQISTEEPDDTTRICKDELEDGTPGSFERRSGRTEIAKLIEKNKMLNQYVIQVDQSCKVYQHNIQQLTKDKETMHGDIQRLRAFIELKQLNKSDKQLSTTSLSPSSIDASDNNNKWLDTELLQQQLQIFKDDFNAEKEEKQKLLKENDGLRKLVAEEKEHCIKQLEIYERDFETERNKRLQLLRFVNNKTELYNQPNHLEKEWKEYVNLQSEKNRINSRLNEIESNNGSYTHPNPSNTRLNLPTGPVGMINSRYQNTQSHTPSHFSGGASTISSSYHPGPPSCAGSSSSTQPYGRSSPYLAASSNLGVVPPSRDSDFSRFSNVGSHSGFVRDNERHWITPDCRSSSSGGKHKSPSESNYRT